MGFLLWMLAVVISEPLWAQTDETIKLSAAYSTDIQISMSDQQVFDQTFIDMPDSQVSLGFLDKPVWIKLHLSRTEQQDKVLFLVVNPPRHEKLTLYQTAQDSRSSSYVSSLPLSEKVHFFSESQKNIFLLPHKLTDGDYFLKIEPFGPMNIQLKLQDAEQLESSLNKKVFSLGGAVFSVVAFSLLSSFLFLISREKIYLLFIFHALASVVVFISTLGFNISVLNHWFGWDLNLQLGMFMILNITSGFLLFNQILRLMALPDWLQRYTYLIPIINLFFLVWFITTHSQVAWLLSTVFGICACLLYAFAFLKFFDKHIRAQWVLALFSSVIFLLLILLMLGLLGWLPFSSQILQPNVLRIGSLPVIFGLIFWFYEVIQKEKLASIQIEKATEAHTFEEERKRRKTYEGFMGMLVHEIKTPLSIIQIASISLGRRFVKDSSEAMRVANIDKAVNDINDILSKCVQVSDIENNTVYVDKTMVDLEELLAELQGLFKSPQIKWPAPDHLPVLTDYILLRTILSNLISNALKYADQKQAIEIKCDTSKIGEDDAVVLAVTNTIGTAGTPDPEHVFERYYRGHLSSGQPGSGLGLWLSQQIAKVLGTEIVMQLGGNWIRFQLSIRQTT